MKIGKVLEALEERAPSGTAENWDNVGLLLGDPDWNTRGAVICIDLDAKAIQAARKRGYRLIVNHHPCIFPRQKGLSRVVRGAGGSGLAFEALRAGIAVIASHTNFDQCALEVVSKVSRGLGVTPRGRWIEEARGSLLKLAVFVPEAQADSVREALFRAGAGQIGRYDQCSFGSPGEGTFRGGEGTDPFLGRPGVMEKAREVRLETVLPRGLEVPVLRALREAHPYEEVAYDLYALEQAPPREGIVRGLGYGFWGDLPASKPFSEVVKDVRSLFNLGGFWLTEPVPRRIRRIGFAAGKGASFLKAASEAGCDLFITGEAGYHTVLDGKRRGTAVLEVGHRESERFFVKTMERWLSVLGLKTQCLDLPNQSVYACLPGENQ